jgi:hypothetical protein
VTDFASFFLLCSHVNGVKLLSKLEEVIKSVGDRKMKKSNISSLHKSLNIHLFMNSAAVKEASLSLFQTLVSMPSVAKSIEGEDRIVIYKFMFLSSLLTPADYKSTLEVLHCCLNSSSVSLTNLSLLHQRRCMHLAGRPYYLISRFSRQRALI